MKQLLPLLVLFGCATPMTEEQREEREYKEQERKIAYVEWERRCNEKGWVVYTYDPVKHCRKRKGCIPHRWDWQYDAEKDGPKATNRTVCVPPQALREVLRNL